MWPRRSKANSRRSGTCELPTRHPPSDAVVTSTAMSALAERIPEAQHDRDHIVRLHDISWAQYETILAMRGDRSQPHARAMKPSLH